MNMKAFATRSNLAERTFSFITTFRGLGPDDGITIHPGQLEADDGTTQAALIIVMQGNLHAFSTAQARVIARGAEEAVKTHEPSDDCRHLLTLARALFQAADETDALMRKPS